MPSKYLPLLEKLAAHSALLALLLMLLSEALAAVLRLLPAPLRPARAWAHPTAGYDLDDRRTWQSTQRNRRVASGDRRRNMTRAPRGFSAFTKSDRRLMARGRRSSDWRFS
jgi:hypothetical protein